MLRNKCKVHARVGWWCLSLILGEKAEQGVLANRIYDKRPLGCVKHLYWLSRIPAWKDSAKTEHLLQEKRTYYWLFLCSLQSVMLLCCHLNHCVIVSYWRVHFNSYLGMEDSSRFLKKWQAFIVSLLHLLPHHFIYVQKMHYICKIWAEALIFNLYQFHWSGPFNFYISLQASCIYLLTKKCHHIFF